MARSHTPNIYAQGEVLAQQLDIPTEAPPSYSTAPLPAFGGALIAASSTTSQISAFKTAIATKRTGSVYLRPYTMAGQIDAVQMYLHGRNYLQSIVKDLPVQPPGAHASCRARLYDMQMSSTMVLAVVIPAITLCTFRRENLRLLYSR